MKSIWKVMLAVCCLGMTIGCGTNPSKNENVKETLPALVVNGTQLMNTEGDTVVLHGVSYGWHQFWPRFYNASSVAYLVNDWGAQVLRASMGVDLDSACYVNKPEFGIECVTKVVDAAILERQRCLRGYARCSVWVMLLSFSQYHRRIPLRQCSKQRKLRVSSVMLWALLSVPMYWKKVQRMV